MEVLQTLSVALGLSALTGYSLYLTVFSTGLAIHFALTFYFLPRIWRSVSITLWFIVRKLNQTSSSETIDKLPDKLPARFEALFRRLTEPTATVAWAAPCVSGKGKYLEPNRF